MRNKAFSNYNERRIFYVEENNNIIKIKAKCNSIIFPRGGFNKNSENMYGIVSWDVSEKILGEPILHPKYGTVTITGQYEAGVEYCTEYRIIAKEVENPKYGKQYQLIQYGEQYNLDSTRDQKAFLRTILTYNQVKEIYKVTDDPIKTIAAHDRETLKKAKGIGDYIVDRIIKRYEENKDYTELYIELDEYGLTPNFIQKLIKEYKNPKKVIETVKKNPYKLCYDVDGVGFRTADNIAIKVGLDEKSPDRVAAFVQWKLDELGKSGDSYISTDKLTDVIYEEFGGKENILEVYRDKDGSITGSNIGKAISQLVLNKVIGVDPPQKQNRRVWLIKYYELEKTIARELKRLMGAKNKFKFDNWENKVSEMEVRQGWSFPDEQKAGIKQGLDNNVCVITGSARLGQNKCSIWCVNCFRML